MSPIYIPSRHRPECQAARMLSDEGIPFRIVVEPHDLSAYQKFWERDQLLQLPKDHQGLAYARKAVKFHSTRNGDPAHWQIDDDVSRFIFRLPGQPSKNIHAAAALEQVEYVFNQYQNVGLAGPNYAWPPKEQPLMFNKLPVQVILINNKMKCTFRPELLMHADMDIWLQALREGWCSVLLDHIRLVSPPVGSNPGGCKERYDTKREESFRQMAKIWPGLTYGPNKNGVTVFAKGKFAKQFFRKPIKK